MSCGTWKCNPSLATRARFSRGIPYVGCLCLLLWEHWNYCSTLSGLAPSPTMNVRPSCNMAGYTAMGMLADGACQGTALCGALSRAHPWC